jgi:predicted Na+-dependent transporter
MLLRLSSATHPVDIFRIVVVTMVDWIALAGNVLLFALVFGMSATVDIDSCRTQVRNGKAILTGIFCQFVVLPVLGFLVVKTLNLDTGIGITLLVVTSSPGGSYSNW